MKDTWPSGDFAACPRITTFWRIFSASDFSASNGSVAPLSSAKRTRTVFCFSSLRSASHHGFPQQSSSQGFSDMSTRVKDALPVKGVPLPPIRPVTTSSSPSFAFWRRSPTLFASDGSDLSRYFSFTLSSEALPTCVGAVSLRPQPAARMIDRAKREMRDRCMIRSPIFKISHSLESIRHRQAHRTNRRGQGANRTDQEAGSTTDQHCDRIDSQSKGAHGEPNRRSVDHRKGK